MGTFLFVLGMCGVHPHTPVSLYNKQSVSIHESLLRGCFFLFCCSLDNTFLKVPKKMGAKMRISEKKQILPPFVLSNIIQDRFSFRPFRKLRNALQMESVE